MTMDVKKAVVTVGGAALTAVALKNPAAAGKAIVAAKDLLLTGFKSLRGVANAQNISSVVGRSKLPEPIKTRLASSIGSGSLGAVEVLSATRNATQSLNKSPKAAKVRDNVKQKIDDVKGRRQS